MKTNVVRLVNRLRLTAVLAACLLGCGEPTRPEPEHGDALSTEEIERLTTSANQGDADAAYRLATYLESDPRSEAQAVHWLSVAASADHDLATQHLITILTTRNQDNDCELATYWLRRLDGRVGNPETRARLGIETMRSNIVDCSAGARNDNGTEVPRKE